MSFVKNLLIKNRNCVESVQGRVNGSHGIRSFFFDFRILVDQLFLSCISGQINRKVSKSNGCRGRVKEENQYPEISSSNTNLFPFRVTRASSKLQSAIPRITTARNKHSSITFLLYVYHIALPLKNLSPIYYPPYIYFCVSLLAYRSKAFSMSDISLYVAKKNVISELPYLLLIDYLFVSMTDQLLRLA